MPNLTRILDSNPTYRAMLTASNGAIYSLGSFNNANNSCMTFYINQKWLDEAGLEVPKTLDEFSEVMAAFKARGEDVVPMAGDLGDSPRFIMNAFGFITHAAASLTTIAMRNGEPTFVYGDREVFPEYLKVVHDYYEKGYFSPNLFADQVAGDETAALKANDLTGFSQNTSGVINPDDWTSCYFLTSDWNPTSQVYRSYSAVNNQSFSISATCDPAKVERLMKWLDWHFDYDNYILMHYGPSAEETDILYGLESGYTATLNEEGRYEWTCAEIENGTYNSFGDYQNLRVQGIIGGYLGLGYDMFEEATREYNRPSITTMKKSMCCPIWWTAIRICASSTRKPTSAATSLPRRSTLTWKSNTLCSFPGIWRSTMRTSKTSSTRSMAWAMKNISRSTATTITTPIWHNRHWQIDAQRAQA